MIIHLDQRMLTYSWTEQYPRTVVRSVILQAVHKEWSPNLELKLMTSSSRVFCITHYPLVLSESLNFKSNIRNVNALPNLSPGLFTKDVALNGSRSDPLK